MYQAAYPDRYFTSQNVDVHGNVWIEDYSTVDANTALLPFRKANREYWTTNDARSTVNLGYAYPETFRSNNVSDAEHINAAKAAVATLYGSDTRARIAAQSKSLSSAHISASPKDYIDWSIKATKLTNDVGSFLARFYVHGIRVDENDKFNDDPLDVGTLTQLMPRSHENHDTTTATPVRPYEGSISITWALLDLIKTGHVRSLDYQDVETFLKTHLKIVILSVGSIPSTCDDLQLTSTQSEGKDITRTSYKSFRFTVFSTPSHIPDDDSQAVEYGEPRAHPDIAVTPV